MRDESDRVPILLERLLYTLFFPSPTHTWRLPSYVLLGDGIHRPVHWSMCVALWNNDVLMPPLPSLVRSTSRNGSCPSDYLSTVNWMFGSILLRCARKGSTRTVIVLSMYLLQKRGGVWKEDRALHSMSSITRFATTTDTAEPMAVPWTCW